MVSLSFCARSNFIPMLHYDITGSSPFVMRESVTHGARRSDGIVSGEQRQSRKDLPADRLAAATLSLPLTTVSGTALERWSG